jgi:hypothetical protein
MSEVEELAEELKELKMTLLMAWVDVEGNGHFEIKVDHTHGPEVAGGLLAELLLQCIPGFEIRGMGRAEVMQRIMMGYQLRFKKQEDDHVIQTMQ